LRMLSVRPEQRGTAAELAEALEQATQLTTPESTRPLFAQQMRPSGSPAEVSSRTPDSAERVSPPARARPWRRRLATAAALLALGAWVWWSIPRKFPEQPTVVRHEAGGARLEDGGTSGLGDEAATTATTASPAPSAPGVLAEDTLPEPVPGQARPDAKGRCPHPQHVLLGSGCWVKTSMDRKECELLKPNGGNMFKGACYMPVLLHGRQPTSDPGRKQ
ncbi:MAG: serine/threonine protein kinase, partial [Myxococcaceae bacterium]|nr:serine/threonine protein kinase [Myxococcaceae bacterium]